MVKLRLQRNYYCLSSAKIAERGFKKSPSVSGLKVSIDKTWRWTLTKQAREENCSCTKDFGGRARGGNQEIVGQARRLPVGNRSGCATNLQATPYEVATATFFAQPAIAGWLCISNRLAVNEHITTAICRDKTQMRRPATAERHVDKEVARSFA
jgi:hypothetical protein